MAQLSKRKLAQDLFERISEILLSVLSQTKTKEEVAVLIDDLLSPTEKVILSKRLAIALMIQKGYDPKEITDTLKVSSATVATVKNLMATKGEGYRNALEKIITRERITEFLENIDELLYKMGHSKRMAEPVINTSKELRKRKIKRLL